MKKVVSGNNVNISKNFYRKTRFRGGGSIIIVGRGRKSRVEDEMLERFYVCQVNVVKP